MSVDIKNMCYKTSHLFRITYDMNTVSLLESRDERIALHKSDDDDDELMLNVLRCHLTY